MTPTVELLLATGNVHKAAEMAQLLTGVPVRLRSRAEFPDLPEVPEDGATFAENALLKATTLCRLTGIAALADDSGLCVDALNGAPGIYSARYGGAACDDDANNQKMLAELVSVAEPDRTAHFVCVIAVALPGQAPVTFEGTTDGRILTAANGRRGFGYDPLFFHTASGCTFAEMDPAEKGRVSHRALAFAEARAWLMATFL